MEGVDSDSLARQIGLGSRASVHGAEEGEGAGGCRRTLVRNAGASARDQSEWRFHWFARTIRHVCARSSGFMAQMGAESPTALDREMGSPESRLRDVSGAANRAWPF